MSAERARNAHQAPAPFTPRPSGSKRSYCLLCSNTTKPQVEVLAERLRAGGHGVSIGDLTLQPIGAILEGRFNRPRTFVFCSTHLPHPAYVGAIRKLLRLDLRPHDTFEVVRLGETDDRLPRG